MDFNQFFYFGVMAAVAGWNFLQYSKSKDLKFRNFLTVFQGVGYLSMIFLYMIADSGSIRFSAFQFWSTLFFFVAASLELVEILLLYCGKIKLVTVKEEKISNDGEKPVAEESLPTRTFQKKKKDFEKNNFQVLQLLGIFISIILTWGISIFSLLLVTGFLFK